MTGYIHTIEMKDKEKKIKGFPNYTVTSTGKVFRNGNEVKPYDNGQGYKQVKLYKDGVRHTKNIHRLVMGEPEGKDVDHIDNNKGDNNISNLQDLSHKDNVRKIFKK